jgi:G:T-mismatch repair DNA endonuclease (very short patch repair protein)
MTELTPASENGNRQKTLKTIEYFLEKAREKHGDRYDYSNVVMNGMGRHIIIGCKTHGDFNQTPSNHLNTTGCARCVHDAKIGVKRKIVRKKPCSRRPSSLEDLLIKAREVHGDKYDYSKVTLENEPYIIIICKTHGEVTQSYYNHLNGNGCKHCAKIKTMSCLRQKLSQEEFVRRCKEKHGDLYDYSQTEYISSSEKVKIRCVKHGIFEADPRKHYHLGYGCPICTGCGVSFAQLEWLKYIEETTKNDIIYKGGKHNKEESFRINGKLYRVDGYCKETNTVYEFLGCWYHGCLKCRKENVIHPWGKKSMKVLNEECIARKATLEANGFTVLYMWECEWKSHKVRSNIDDNLSEESGGNSTGSLAQLVSERNPVTPSN